MGGQNGPKIENLGVFWGMLLESLFFVKICMIFDKNDGEKHMELSMSFDMLVHRLFAEFVVFLHARTLKNRDFTQGKCIFL